MLREADFHFDALVDRKAARGMGVVQKPCPEQSLDRYGLYPSPWPEAAPALEALKRYFGAGSVLSAIRNRISFHYSDKENLTEASFQQLARGTAAILSAKTVGKLVLSRCRADHAISCDQSHEGPAGRPERQRVGRGRAFAVLCDEIIEVSRHITELFGELIATLSENVVGEWPRSRCLTDRSSLLFPYLTSRRKMTPYQCRARHAF